MSAKVYTVKLHVNNSLLEFTIHDDLIINHDNYEYSKHAYLLHDAGFPICIVFADNEEDAIDEAFNNKKLDEYALTEDDEIQYQKDGLLSSITHAGNHSVPVDIESITILELPKPKRLSYCATLIEHLDSIKNSPVQEINLRNIKDESRRDAFEDYDHCESEAKHDSQT